nr:immunoglobulin light chain junction region [Macaca mulatta]
DYYCQVYDRGGVLF